jgi:ATP synthase protein I
MQMDNNKSTHAKDWDSEEPIPVAWSAEQAQAFREKDPSFSIATVLFLQASVGVLLCLVTGLVSNRLNYAWSAGYGVLVVLLPSLLFARGLKRSNASRDPGVAMRGFFIWEFVKLMSMIALLALSSLFNGLNWLLMLLGMGITMKIYWICMWRYKSAKAMNQFVDQNVLKQ